MSHVHPECHLSLAAIAAEMSLAHEESDQKSGGEVIRGRMSRRGVGFPMHGATVAQVVSP